MKIENDTSDCAVLFLRSFRVQNWCKFGAKTYRTMQKLCNDMRRKRHKIAQNERFSTIFRGINASRKTPRDNFDLWSKLQKALRITRSAFCYLLDEPRCSYDCPSGKLWVMIGYAKLWCPDGQFKLEWQSYHNDAKHLITTRSVS